MQCDARSEVRELLEKMRVAARDPARVRLLTDQLEVCVLSHLEPSLPDPLPGVRMTKAHRRVFARLKQAEGRTVSKDALMNALYFDRIDDAPAEKIIDVWMCKLRPLLKGSGYSIQTMFGSGYRLNREC